jgi:hypothetical protein
MAAFRGASRVSPSGSAVYVLIYGDIMGIKRVVISASMLASIGERVSYWLARSSSVRRISSEIPLEMGSKTTG